MVSKGQFVGLDWNRITRLHSQVMIGTQEVKNSLTASRCHLKAYPRCGQPTSKVSILKMKQQQHDINLRRTQKKKIRSFVFTELFGAFYQTDILKLLL